MPLEGELGAKPHLKKGGQMKSYQFSRPLSRSDDERGEKRSQKSILSEFKATYVENFFRFVSISLKLDGIVGTTGNWRCIRFGLNRLNGGGEIRVTQIPEFQENENLTTESAKIQHVVELL